MASEKTLRDYLDKIAKLREDVKKYGDLLTLMNAYKDHSNMVIEISLLNSADLSRSIPCSRLLFSNIFAAIKRAEVDAQTEIEGFKALAGITEE